MLRHYDIPGIELNREIAGRIEAGTLTWKQFGGVHPGPDGNRICANMIERLFDRAWAEGAAAEKARALPEPLDPNCYEAGRFLDPAAAQIRGGWSLGVPDWSKIPGSFRSRFARETLICATEPGAELTLPFDGRAIGVYVLAGPDAGMVDASIDGAPAKSVDLFHPYSAGLHYPRTVIFDAELRPGPHVLVLRLSDRKNPASKGSAARILRFCAN